MQGGREGYTFCWCSLVAFELNIGGPKVNRGEAAHPDSRGGYNGHGSTIHKPFEYSHPITRPFQNAGGKMVLLVATTECDSYQKVPELALAIVQFIIT